MVKRSREVAAQLTNGVAFLMKKNKIDVIWGEAAIEAPGKVAVKASKSEPPKGALGAGSYQAKHIIIATGARPRVLPGIEPDGKLVWTYFEAMAPPAMPKSLLVIGSGAIGIEFASLLPHARRGGDGGRDAAADPAGRGRGDRRLRAQALREAGHQDHDRRQGDEARQEGGDGVTATIDDGKGGTQTLTVERVISAVGVVGNIENLGLEKLGVKTERGIIVADGYGRTNVPGIYAIGDVAGPPMLAHKAEHEGVVCVEAIAGPEPAPARQAARSPAAPTATRRSPPSASPRRRPRQQGHEIKVGHFPFIGNGKAIALGEDQGLVKTIFDAKTGQLLGAHMVGAEVTELIQGFVIAMKLETTEEELMHTVFPHPTLSEMMHESVLDAYGRVIHV